VLLSQHQHAYEAHILALLFCSCSNHLFSLFSGNGDRDMTTNVVGGWVKECGNLTFAAVYNSGHMVPYDGKSATTCFATPIFICLVGAVHT